MNNENEIILTEKTIHRTVIVEWVTILGAIIACFGILYIQINNLESKITLQSQRTDKLYEMFIDLLKERK